MSGQTIKIVLAVAATWLIWGSTYLAIRISIIDMPPFFMAGLRFAIAGFILYVFLRLRGAPAPDSKQWPGIFLLALLLLVGGHGSVVYAEQWIPSALAALAVASMPIWATVFAAVFGRKSTVLDVIAILIGFAGVIVLNLDGELRAHGWATLILMFAPVSWAFGSMISRYINTPAGLMVSASQMLAGGLLLLVISFVLGEPFPERITLWPALAFVYQIVFGSMITFTAYLFLLNNARPALATSYAFVNPLVAVLLGVGFANEKMDAWGFSGMAVIVIAVAVITLQRKPTKQ
ncbi:MAG: drug/metabolite exporter YedA [Gammaproteobacteria bacterium]|nr:drug/metabolite exporter YedA [Gammaproteobacteria bacterium]